MTTSPSSPLFTMVQLNDAHLRAGEDVYNSRGKLAAVLRALDSGRHPFPDLVLLAGDLLDRPSEEHYALLHEVTKPLRRAQVVMMAGNHEIGSPENAEHLALYQKWCGPDRLNYSFDFRGVRFIILYNGEGDGQLSPLTRERNQWLEAELAWRADQPKVVVAHVPLIPMRDPEVLAASFDFPTWVEQYPEHRLLKLLVPHRDSIIAVLGAHLHLSAHAEREGLHFMVPSGTLSWPHDYGWYEFWPGRLEVRLIGPEPTPAPGEFGQMPLANGIHDRHDGREFTDARHPSFASYIRGTEEERSITIPLAGKRRINAGGTHSDPNARGREEI